MNYKLVYSEDYSNIELVHDALYTYNTSRTGRERLDVHAKCCAHPGAWLMYGDDNSFMGGIVWHYEPELHSFEVDYLYVDEQLRGSGAGRRLMEFMEKTAAERAVKYIRLTTNTFQAPEFYRKIGYNELAAKPAPHPWMPENIHYTFIKYMLADDEDKK